jgi:hypothetical protein
MKRTIGVIAAILLAIPLRGQECTIHDHLIANWHLDETGGFKVNDYDNWDSYVLDMWDGGSPGVAGKVGNAASSNGATGYAYVPANAQDLHISTPPLEMTFWLNVQNYPAANSYGALAGKGDLSCPQYMAFLFTGSGGGNWVKFMVSDSNCAWYVAAAAGPTAGTWAFIDVYWDSSNSVGICVDNSCSTYAGGPSHVTAGQFRIFADSSNANAADAYLDELMLWTRNLTSAERSYLYNSGAGRRVGQ